MFQIFFDAAQENTPLIFLKPYGLRRSLKTAPKIRRLAALPEEPNDRWKTKTF
jgi:hypothetical protein